MTDCSIRILPTDVANKIAAGEVIERPSSVVKELVENAIDAGASKIVISLQDGGKTLIKVIDDGVGMTRDELRLSIERHATSKIKDLEDIENIRTLGFRGEALPSILAVSKLRIKSRKRGAQDAWQLISDFGEGIRIEPANIPGGTTIEVGELFENLPARKKFLKSTHVEFQHALTLVKIFAVCYHELEFRLYHQNKLVFSSTPNAFGIEVVLPLFNEKYSNFFTHEEDFGDVRIRFVITTSEDLLSQKGLYYFLNRRLISGRLFNKVVMDATKTALGREFSPVGVIFIECPPDYYDVNVHPSKMEVKFHKTGDIFRKLFVSLRNALHKDKGKRLNLMSHTNHTNGANEQTADWKDVLRYLYSKEEDARRDTPEVHTQRAIKLENSEPKHANAITRANEANETIKCDVKRDPAHLSGGLSPEYVRILGQLNNSFILIETVEALSIIDQHALHEAIIFNDLLRHYVKNESYPSQLILFPEVISVTNDQLENFLQHKHDLKMLGLDMEIFGDDELLIRSMPLVKFFNARDVDFKEFLDKILSSSVNDRSIFMHNAIAVISCDLAVKSGTVLKYEEMRWLVDTMFEKGITNCPHGRPVMYTITLKEIKSHLGKR